MLRFRRQGKASAVDIRTTLPPDPGSAAAARRFVADVLMQRGFSNSTIQDAVLLASEAVTNAIVHAGTDVDVVVVTDSSMARVEVHDRDPSLPVTLALRPDLARGRGLHVIEALSEAWGISHQGESGKCIWFELRS